jgi:hypothetical protein
MADFLQISLRYLWGGRRVRILFGSSSRPSYTNRDGSACAIVRNKCTIVLMITAKKLNDRNTHVTDPNTHAHRQDSIATMVRRFYTDRQGRPIPLSGGVNAADSSTAAATMVHHYHRHGQRPATTVCRIVSKPSALYQLVERRDWDAVVRRCVSHADEVLEQIYASAAAAGSATALPTVAGAGNAAAPTSTTRCPGYTTALHLACRLDPPPEVIAAMAALARVRDEEGRTPLHMAASHRCSVPSLAVLLEAAGCQIPPPYQRYLLPNNNDDDDYDDETDDDDDDYGSPTADLTRIGRAPIHYACASYRSLAPDAFRLLFEITLREGNIIMDDDTLSRYEEDSTLLGDNDWCVNAANSKDDLCWEESEVDPYYFDEEPLLHPSPSKNDEKKQGDDDDDLGCLKKSSSHSAGFKMPTPRPRRSTTPPPVLNVLGMKDTLGHTPLALLFRRYRERVRSVISRVDRLQHSQRAALVAAVTVQADLGELWEKARWIVARLTEERLAKEQPEEEVAPQPPVACTDPEVAVAREAAAWAAEQYHVSTRHRLKPTSSSSSLLMPVPEAGWAEEQPPPPPPAGPPLDDSDSSQGSGPEDHSPTIHHRRSTTSTPVAATAQSRRRPFRIVHASVGLTGYGCPPEMIRLAISLFPHQVREMDEDGNLPLHIAATAESYLSTVDLTASPQAVMASLATTNTPADTQSLSDEMSVLSEALSFFSTKTVAHTNNPFDKVLKILLTHYPDAARIPHGRSGQLPLVLAVECGRRTWPDGLRTLLNAYPPALHNKKLINQVLYPNVLSLITVGRQDPTLVVPEAPLAPATRNEAGPGSLRPVLSSSPLSSRHLHAKPAAVVHTSDQPARSEAAATTPPLPPPVKHAVIALGKNGDLESTTPLPRVAFSANVGGGRARSLAASARRREIIANRSTLYALVRAKPEWLNRLENE